jgi:acyl transferase domain-containing protein/acyl carrier protein
MAIVGMAGRFPGAANIDEFWRNLINGVESLTELDTGLMREAGISESKIADPNHVRLVPLMDDIEGFDARYFGYHAREAQVADPQQRIFLEVCHTALEHAGYDPRRYDGRIGVYGGGAPNSYGDQYAYSSQKVRAVVGDLGIEINNASDYVATRVAFALGLTGPAVSVTTACSTALVAVHLAGQALAGGECTMAIAGAVNVRTPYYKGHIWAEDSIYSRDGHVRPFDADASGTNFGYGAGAVVLKRYEDALADGDTVYALVIGSAINNDGADRASFSAPGAAGQTTVVTQALRAAGISPDTIGYVEAHGTGTTVGDPIEVAALSAAYRHAGCTAFQSTPIGSVKSNIGHLGAAAGMPGLIKTVLAMRHRRLPASLHYQRPNPRIAFAETPFHVVRKPRSWPKTGGPMRAGVSSFGIGGTNAHVIVEGAPEPPATDPGRPWLVLPLSAKSATALDTMRTRLVEHLASNQDAALADVGYTLQMGRQQLARREFAVCRNDPASVAGLQFSDTVQVTSKKSTPVVFMFPGQGAQYVDMAEEVYRTEAVFHDAVDECARLAGEYLGQDLRDVVFSSRNPGVAADELAQRLRRTEYTQPALFMIEYALARLWLSWGVEPEAMVGHSIGEIVAACLAEVFSLRAAIEFVVTRGRLVQSMPGGSMLALPLAESDADGLLSDAISLSAVNAPRATVVAGPHDAITALNHVLERTGVQATVLRTSHAFHSWMLEPIVAPLRDAAQRAELKPPTRRFVSTVTGEWITDEEATSPDYWAAQVRQPVRFAKAVQTVAASGAVLLEVGPGRTLSSMARQALAKAAKTVTSLSRPGGESSESATLASRPSAQSATLASRPSAQSAMLASRPSAQSDGQSLARAVGQLWVGGLAFDWAAFNAGQRRRRVALPAYPYERTRFWLDIEPDTTTSAKAEPSDHDGMTYVPTWRQRRLAAAADEVFAGPLLVFTPGLGPVEAAADELCRHGRTVVRVVPGDSFAELGDNRFQVSPTVRTDYDELAKALDAGVGRPTTVLHGWTATAAAQDPYDLAEVRAVRDAGFYSVLFLTQAFTTRWPAATLTLRLATTYSADVSGTETIEPAKALLQGPGKVVPIEQNQVTCQFIDVGPTVGAEQLLNELAAPIVDRMVAYRGGRRWVADYEPATALSSPVAMPRGLRRRGVYLITGGLGDIGLLVAKELARTVGARLVLTGRTALPDRAEWDTYLALHKDDKVSRGVRAIRELESIGGEVLAVAADVTDEPAMRAAVEAARERFGRIDGVLHTAGIAGAGLASMKSREQAESVLRPKVDGTLVLDRVLGNDIDLFVLFSSIFGITGGYGQVDYCAGNSFMDAFAQSRADGRAQTLSVAWCGWSGVGMLAEEEASAASAETASTADALDDARLDDARLDDARLDETCLGEKAPGLLGRRVLDCDDVVFAANIEPDWHWVLTDHRMKGRQVFPGTSYAEMMTAAAREVFGGGPVELRDIIFSRPLAIDGPRELRVTGVRQESGAYQFTVTSRPQAQVDAAWDRHASATANAHHAPQPPRQDVIAIATRCDVLSWKPELSDPDSVVVFGPHWQVVQSVALGQGEQLARLELPAGLDSDLAEYVLHPALLDGATALSLYIPQVVQGGHSYLPIAYDRIVVRDALPTRFHSHVRNRGGVSSSGIMSFDIALLDDGGRELVTIEGFSVRVVDVETVHAGLDAPAQPSAQRSAQRLGLARDELLLESDRGLDLLWRMLDTRSEPHYVVTIESIADKVKRLAGIADQVAGALEAARAGAFANAGAVRVARASRADAEPTSPTEKLPLPLWEDAFGVSDMGLDEDFFDLGGNSLVAVQLAVRIRDTFGVNMPGVAVLEYPTVRTLAQFVDSSRADTTES